MVSKKDIQKEYKNLKEKIKFHNEKYHSQDDPDITDQEFDLLFKQLKELEKNNAFLDTTDSPSRMVGGKKLSELTPFEHGLPMLSLDNAFSSEDLKDFEKRNLNKLKQNIDFSYLVEPKIDGVAISLFYENGNLLRAGTRGDGFVGEDVTHNVLTIPEIPMTLNRTSIDFPKKMEVRGEIFIELNDFSLINKDFKKNNKKVFANPRNFVAGSIRQLDSSIAAKRPLKIFCHSIGLVSDRNFFETQDEMLKKFHKWGLPISKEVNVCNNLDEAAGLIDLLTEKRNKLNYEIDGIVVKINSKAIQEKLGNSSRSPRWAIAKKFPAEEGESRILSISFQMGRTGILTPVANLEPVKLGGVTISNATLHNMDEVKRLDVRENDYVKIIRAGDVIPKIKEVVLKKREEGSKTISPPNTCPTCDNTISFFESNTPLLNTDVLTTNNKNCYGFSQFKETLKHFVSRNAMDIDGLGQKTIDIFVDKELVTSLPDLYRLNEEDILSLEGFAEKSADKLLDSLNESLNTDLHRFIYALGIKEIGIETSKNLSKYFENLESFFSIKYEDYLEVNDVGEVAAANLENFFKSDSNKKILEELLKLGLDLKPPIQVKESHLTSKVIVITGKLSNYSRESLKLKLENLGAKVSNSLSKKTDYLIAGEDPGSKLSKAKQLNIDIIGYSDLDGFLNNL